MPPIPTMSTSQAGSLQDHSPEIWPPFGATGLSWACLSAWLSHTRMFFLAPIEVVATTMGIAKTRVCGQAITRSVATGTTGSALKPVATVLATAVNAATPKASQNSQPLIGIAWQPETFSGGVTPFERFHADRSPVVAGSI